MPEMHKSVAQWSAGDLNHAVQGSDNMPCCNFIDTFFPVMILAGMLRLCAQEFVLTSSRFFYDNIDQIIPLKRRLVIDPCAVEIVSTLNSDR